MLWDLLSNSEYDISPEKIVYVSCNRATQARDLALMNDVYKVTKTQASKNKKKVKKQAPAPAPVTAEERRALIVRERARISKRVKDSTGHSPPPLEENDRTLRLLFLM